MEPLVVDSSVIVAAFREQEEFYQQGKVYVDGLEAGDYLFHLPMLVVVEVASAINRQIQRNQRALLMTWNQNVIDWERDGRIVLYELNRERMVNATSAARRYRLRGSDAVLVALAEELDVSLKTFDSEIQGRFLRASA